MKNRLNIRSIIISCILFLIMLCSCKNKVLTTKQYFPNGKVSLETIYKDENDRSSCKIREYYPSGKLRAEVVMQNGKYIDKKVVFFESGGIAQIDSLNGPCDTSINKCDEVLIHYYENGNISDRSVLKDHEYNGSVEYFDLTGKLRKSYVLISDSIKNGPYLEYFPNGQVAYKSYYLKNSEVGEVFFFGENGDTLKSYGLYDGQISLPYKKWLENDVVLSGDYIDKTGHSVLWVWADKNGREIKRKLMFPKNKRIVVPD